MSRKNITTATLATILILSTMLSVDFVVLSSIFNMLGTTQLEIALWSVGDRASCYRSAWSGWCLTPNEAINTALEKFRNNPIYNWWSVGSSDTGGNAGFNSGYFDGELKHSASLYYYRSLFYVDFTRWITNEFVVKSAYLRLWNWGDIGNTTIVVETSSVPPALAGELTPQGVFAYSGDFAGQNNTVYAKEWPNDTPLYIELDDTLLNLEGNTYFLFRAWNEGEDIIPRSEAGIRQLNHWGLMRLVLEISPKEKTLYGSVEDGHNHPLQSVRVTLEWNGREYVEYTNDFGSYSFFVDDPTFRVGSNVEGRLNVTLVDENGFIEVYDQSASPDPVWFQTSFRLTTENDLRRDIYAHINTERIDNTNIPTIHLDDLAAIYHFTYQGVKTARVILGLNLDHPQLPVEVRAYVPGITTHYNAIDANIEIWEHDSDYGDGAAGDGLDMPDNREFHEFSHHIMTDSLIGGDNHMPARDGTNHGGYANPTSADSWVEGFAEFMSMVISDTMANDPDSNLYTLVGNTLDLELNYKVYENLGVREEFAVAGILWDLYDGIDPVDGDNIQLPLNLIWNTLNNATGRRNLKEVYDAFREVPGINITALDWVFITHRAFNDTNDNYHYDQGEPVGFTSAPWLGIWNRHKTPPMPGGYLYLTVKDNTANHNIDRAEFLVEIRHDPPFNIYDYIFTIEMADLPRTVPLIMTPEPAEVHITAQAEGYYDSDPVVLNSTFYWEHAGDIAAILEKTDDYFLNHTFLIDPKVIPLKNPYTLTIASLGEPDTLDPAKCYDSASGALLFNVYETLVFWDENNLDEFVGMIAEDYSISPDGLTYTFTIREGIPWHDPAYGTVTAEDVEYSLERVLVLDYTGGPEWMLYEPLLLSFHADLDDPDWGTKIDNAVTRDGNVVTLHLQMPYPILHVLSNCYGGSILCKQWCIDHGDWPGTFDVWLDYHDPENPWMDLLDHSSPGPHLDAMMGCGPYCFDYWDRGIEWQVKKFDDYWRGWPNPETTYLGHPRRGYVERCIHKKVGNWSIGRDGFMAGCYDSVMNLRGSSQLAGVEEIECLYPYPAYGVTGMFFGFNVSTASPYLGVPGGLPYGTLDKTGIPPDFFADVDVRKGFAYCVDYWTLIEDTLLEEAWQPTSPLCAGLAPDFRNPDQPVYRLDLEQAEAHFRAAYGGELWTTGFTCGITYDTGSAARQTVCEMLKANIESLNPKFHIEIYAVDWSTYISQLVTFQLNMYVTGWGADYPDAHNFMYTFMGTYGHFSNFQRIAYDDVVDWTTYPVGARAAEEYPFDTDITYGNAYVDALLDWGINLVGVDDVLRSAVYNTLQEIYFDQCGSVCLWDAWARRWQRDWVQGWYYHGIYPGSYAYAIWKEELPRTDMNEDGTVNILDISRVAAAFGSYFTPGEPIHLRWDPFADVNADAQINILDVAGVAMDFGFVAPDWNPPP